jgi:MFS superfamily sulfate permease-like transporter
VQPETAPSPVADQAPPPDGWAGLRQHCRTDALAGFLVSLIALPLCLGIALASGFPPVAGLITAVVGGLVVGPWAGSPLGIKGPAAGLIAILATAVGTFGQMAGPGASPLAGYKMTLAVVVLAGAVQMGLGWLGWGRLVNFFPRAVVEGMLICIGIFIISRQLYVLLGVTPTASSPLGLLADWPAAMARAPRPVAAIGLLSLGLLIGLAATRVGWLKKLPPPLVVIAGAVALGWWWQLPAPHLVRLPAQLAQGLQFPDFKQVVSWPSLQFTLLLAVVGSLESLLISRAMVALDPFRRPANLNRDLLATGAGNLLGGLLGGLPMITEVVRSSANASYGAKTRWANVAHGLFLLLAVGLLPGALQHIPLAALAALLIAAGWRLAAPGQVRRTARTGPDQLAVLLATVAAILLTDLLSGILLGLVLNLGLLLVLGADWRQLFRARVEVRTHAGTTRVKVRGNAVFSNFLHFQRQLAALPPTQVLEVDFAEARLVDHAFLEQLLHLQADYAQADRQLSFTGLDQLKPLAAHELATRRAATPPPAA